MKESILLQRNSADELRRLFTILTNAYKEHERDKREEPMISYQDLRGLANASGEDIKDQDLLDIINEAARDPNKGITYEEFNK